MIGTQNRSKLRAPCYQKHFPSSIDPLRAHYQQLCGSKPASNAAYQKRQQLLGVLPLF